MASYLGKISAVVVANTTGFQRNLNSAASDLRNFAGVVQRDITRASSEANKAFSSMLTPLQRLERSLQAASSMKLSFRGFAGAIRTVDELRDRLTRLQGSQVDLVVKASGLRTISQFRQALEGIQQKDFDFAVRFGGTAGLREIRRQIDTLSQESVNATLFAGRQPGVTNVRARLESLRETVDSLSGRSLQLALQVGGEQKLRRAEQQAIGLSKRDLQLFLRVGGREGLDRVIEEIQTVDKTTIDALVSVRGVAELDAVLEKIDQLSPEQITTVLNVLGEQDLVSATQKMRALASAGRQVFEPLAAAASQLPALGLDVEMAFTPGLRRAQRAADALKQEIESIGSGASANRLPGLFRDAEAAATRTTQAFARLRQASSAVAAFDDGTSFRFVQPEAAATVERAINAQRQSLGLSPEQFRQGNFGFRSSQISAEIGEIERLNAAREAVFVAGPGFGARGAQDYRAALQEADAAIVSQVQKVNNLLNIYERITDEITAADRARAASSELNILSTDDLQESRRSIARQASDQLPVLSDQELRDSISSELGLGPDIEDSRRQFSVLGQQVASLKGQLDQLPLPVRAQFVPAIKQAEDNLIRLRGAADASQEEIQQAADALRQLERSVNFAGRIEQFNRQFGDLGQFLQGSRVNQFAGELQALQQILGRVGVEAGSDAAQAFQRLQRAMAAALDPRNLNSEAVIAELNAARTAAINAASAAGGGRPAGIRRQLSRAGDISRFGADNASLALQQAAFAIDDFFSATGDISQKIRAVQNNVTQLAFILGGTTGLFVGLGVAIAAQAAVALVKWTQGTVDASDRTKALNDSLARQKSLVEELKQAFDSLGDFLTRGIFDEATERAREFDRQIEDIRRKSAEVRQEQAASLDAGVNEQRAIQADLRNQLDRETDAGARVGIERRIAASQEEERRLSAQAANRQVDVAGVLREVAESFSEQADAAVKDIFADSIARAGPTAAERFAAAREADALSEPVIQRSQSESEATRRAIGGAGGNVLDIAEILDSRVQELSERLSESVGPKETRAINQQIGELESVLRSLKAPIERALLELRLSLLDSAVEVAGSLRASKDIIANSLGGFGPLATEQRALTAEFDRITSELKAGATAGVDGVLGTDDDIALTREATEARKEELQRIRELVDGNLSAVRSTEAFSNALDRLAGDLADTVLGEAQSAEQQARRDVNRLQAELNTLPADATPRERLDATARLRDAQQRQAELAASADDIAARRRQLAGRQALEVEQFQRQARAGNLGNDLQRQIRARDAIQGRIDAGQNVASDERARLAELTASIADAFENSLAGVQLAAEADAIDVQRQEVDAGLQRARQQAEERQRSVASGLELIQSPEQTAAQRGLDQFNNAINGALSQVADELESIAPNLPQLDDGIISLQELGTLFSQFPNQIGGIREQFLANLQQARDNITGNISAQIAQFDVERSRPSRQALQAQDINTQQGRAELNRLLRGDDGNRDQPILQGIKEQTAILKLIDGRIDEVNRVVGVAGA